MESRSPETEIRWTAAVQGGHAQPKCFEGVCRAWKDGGAARCIYTLVFCSSWRAEARVEQELQAARPDLTVVGTWLCAGLHSMEGKLKKLSGKKYSVYNTWSHLWWGLLSGYGLSLLTQIPLSLFLNPILPWVHWHFSNTVLSAAEVANPWFAVLLYSLAGCLRRISFNKQ